MVDSWYANEQKNGIGDIAKSITDEISKHSKDPENIKD